MATHPTPALHALFVTGLQNAHAVENQALALIDRQLDRLIRYPEISDRLREHRRETEQQIVRLEDILRSFGERSSSLKDMALGLIGNMAALGHVLAPDEVLKDSFVNYAFEHFEIASYRSLLALADASGLPTATTLLEETLREEERMAAWLGDMLPGLTLKYAGLREDGRPASR
jgi:ferritin-like metal-binding protein YciE